MARTTNDRAQRTRECLIRAAAEVFDESGYAGAGITRILERAGVTAGAMYFHFKGKEDLAVAVMNAQQGVVEPRLTSHGLQRLVDITLVWARRLQTDPVLRAGVRLAVEQGSFGLQDATAYVNWRDSMRECLEGAAADGELRAGVDPRTVAEFVVGACTGIQLYSQLVSGRVDLPERTVAMWELLLPGVVAPDAYDAISLDLKRGEIG
jgi:AcrR family transcriptional regulator